MHKYGLMGIPYSREFGGVGGDYLSYALCMEEVSKIDGSTGITISVHTSLCCSCIDGFGTRGTEAEVLKTADRRIQDWMLRSDRTKCRI